jgi:hypothetical protein
MEVSGQIHSPAALHPDKEPLVPSGLEGGWTPEPVWTRWRIVKFPAPVGTRTPGHPARSPMHFKRFRENIFLLLKLRR